jgi:hypothetical protein
LPDHFGLLLWPTFRSVKVDLRNRLQPGKSLPRRVKKSSGSSSFLLTGRSGNLHDDPLSSNGKIVLSALPKMFSEKS